MCGLGKEGCTRCYCARVFVSAFRVPKEIDVQARLGPSSEHRACKRMAVFITLPEELSRWESVQTALAELNEPRALNARLHMFGLRVLRGDPPLDGTPPMSVEQFNMVVNTVRAVSPFAMLPSLRPPTEEPVVVQKIKAAAPNRETAFTWRWMPVFADASLFPVAETDHSVTVAIAVLTPALAVQGFAHLVAIAQVLSLAPFKRGVSLRLQADAPIWDLCRALKVPASHCVRSSRSLQKLIAARGDAIATAGVEGPRLEFVGFMGTFFLLMALFADILCVPNQRGSVQLWARDTLHFFLRVMPSELDLPFSEAHLQIRNGSVDANAVHRFVDALGLLGRWRAKPRRGQGLRFPECGEGQDPCSFTDVLVFLLRWARFSPRTLRIARALVHIVAGILERTAPEHLLQQPRSVRFLPENDRIARRVAAGEDKTTLIVNNLLGRRQGPRIETEVQLREVAHRKSFAWARWAGTVSIVATAITRAQEHYRHVISNWRGTFIGVRVSLDDSRVAKQEVTVSHVRVGDLLSTPPIQVKPDQAAMLERCSAFKNFEAVIRGGAGGRVAPIRIRTRAKTVGTLHALANILFSVLPVETLGMFCPTSAPFREAYAEDVLQRAHDEMTGKEFYFSNGGRMSEWCLSEEILGNVAAAVWVLVLVGDEESTTQALFFWMAGQYSARIIFWRDPSHRLSNLFVRSLRAVPGLLAITGDHMVLHKYRRAPYGSGRFMKEAKETIALLLTQVEKSSAIIGPYVEAIANDTGCEPNLTAVVGELRRFLRMAMGPRVEMRRWFTYIEMAPALDRIWHILLLSLTAVCIFEGQDPWQRAAESRAAIEALGEDASDERRNFAYKSECLRILMDWTLQAALRSVAIVFGRTKTHQKWVAKHAGAKNLSLRYQQFWSDRTHYLDLIVVPSIEDALCSRSALQRIGFTGSVGRIPNQATQPDAHLEEERHVLRLHWLCIVELVWQWWLFVQIPQMPPWCFVLILSKSPVERVSAVEFLRGVFRLLTRLEESRHAIAKEFLKALPWRTWAVVREVLELFHMSGWRADCDRAVAYIEQLAADFLHTLFEEVAFNDLRDNEARSAKHKSRGEHCLSALAMSSCRTRYPEVPQVDVVPEAGWAGG